MSIERRIHATLLVIDDPRALRSAIEQAPIRRRAAVLAAFDAGGSLESFWSSCDVPDALLWIAAWAGADRKAVLRAALTVLDRVDDLLLGKEEDRALASALDLARRAVDEQIEDAALEAGAQSLRGLRGTDALSGASVAAWGCVDAVLGASQSWIDDATFAQLAASVARRASNARSFVDEAEEVQTWDQEAARAIRERIEIRSRER